MVRTEREARSIDFRIWPKFVFQGCDTILDGPALGVVNQLEVIGFQAVGSQRTRDEHVVASIERCLAH